MNTAQTIDEVIDQLDIIIETAKKNQDPAGYFAALYRKVTLAVKEGIAKNAFEDGARMEKLDVVFANRYLNAYHAYRYHQPLTNSWEKAMDMTKKSAPLSYNIY